MIFSLPLLLALGASGLAPPREADLGDLQGRVVGVCIRWGDDRSRVEEAVVVVPSGNDALDRGMPESIRSMEWQNSSDGRGWTGIWLAVGNGVAPGDMPARFPDCSHLPQPPHRAGTSSGMP